jgi:predicted hydrocarbon binding protein
MKTNSTMTAPMRVLSMNQNPSADFLNTTSLSKRERRALEVIYSHAGKRFVFETYTKKNPEMAHKYLEFVSRNPWAVYIKWDDQKMKFVA